MEDGKMTVPYIVYEGEQTRHERTVKRLIIALIVAISAVFVSNAMWLYCWMQFDYEWEDTVTLETTDRSNANFIGGNGVIANGGTDYSIEETFEDEE